MLLSCSTDPGQLAGRVRFENGVPIYRFKKEIVRTGDFYKEADKLEFTVTTETLDHWEKEFDKWVRNGNKVSVPETHDGAQDPKANRGWVIDMFREGDSLYAIIDMYGVDSPKIAATNDVSIYSVPSVVDGRGVKYNRPITHVALCTDPVIPGLSKFEAIAASRKEISMAKGDIKAIKHSSERNYDMNVKKLGKLLGLSFTDEEDEDDMEKKVTASIAKLVAANAREDDDDNDNDSDDDEEEIKATKKVKAAKVDDDDEDEKKKVSASRTKQVDPILIRLSAENRANRLNRLVEMGKITPAVRDEIEKKYVTEKALAVSLSLGGDDGFDNIVDLFDKNDVVELTEKTSAQVLVLGDNLKAGKNPLIEDAKARSKK